MDEVDELQLALKEYNATLASDEKPAAAKPRKILNAPLPSDRLLTPGARKR